MSSISPAKFSCSSPAKPSLLCARYEIIIYQRQRDVQSERWLLAGVSVGRRFRCPRGIMTFYSNAQLGRKPSMASMGKSRRRSSPIYVRSAGKVISLVAEIEAQELRLKVRSISLNRLSPSALYVIDEDGVARLKFRRSTSRLALLGIGLLSGPLQYYLLGRRKVNDVRR